MCKLVFLVILGLIVSVTCVPQWDDDVTYVQCERGVSAVFDVTYSPPEPFSSVTWTFGGNLVVSWNASGYQYGTGYSGRVTLSTAPGDVTMTMDAPQQADGGFYHVITEFPDGTNIEADINLKVYTARQIQSELDNMDVEVNGEQLVAGTPMELEYGQTDIFVKLAGGDAPDMLCDVIVSVNPNNGDPYEVKCEQIRECALNVKTSENDQCEITFYVGFETSSNVYYPIYPWGAAYAVLVTWLYIFTWICVGVGALLVLIAIVVPPAVIIPRKMKRAKNMQDTESVTSADDGNVPSYTNASYVTGGTGEVDFGSKDPSSAPPTYTEPPGHYKDTFHA